MKSLTFFQYLILLLSSFSVYATNIEIDPTIKYLIGTPTTLMDKGIFEIDRMLKEGNSNSFYINKRSNLIQNGAFSGSARVKHNRIEIRVYLYPPSIVQPTKACQDLLHYGESVLGFRSVFRGKVYSNMLDQLSEIFGHYGYSPASHPDNLGGRLLGLVHMQAAIITDDGGKFFCNNVGGGEISDGKIN